MPEPVIKSLVNYTINNKDKTKLEADCNDTNLSTDSFQTREPYTTLVPGSLHPLKC